MVRRLLHFLSRESAGIHQAALLLGSLTFASQLLGLLRDRLLAHNFGAGLQLDLYYAAFRLPDFIFVSAASLVSVSVLIPFLAPKLEKPEEMRPLLDSVFSFFFILVTVAAGAVFLLSPFLLKLIFPGFNEPVVQQELVALTRLLLLSPIFLGLSSLLASLNQLKRRFLVYALSPVLYNLGIIAGLVFLAPFLGIRGAAVGVVGGALLHFLLQLIFVWRDGFRPRFSFQFETTVIRPLIWLSVPRTLALGAHQLALLVLVALASLLSAGSIAILNLSLNLQSVPLAIIGVSYSLAAFPLLSQLFVNGQRQLFLEQVTSAAKHIIFWSLPVIVLFVVLRAQIVRTILGSGLFDWRDTRLTAAALAIFACSVVFQGLNLLLVRGYYSTGRTLKPLLVNVCSAAGAVLLAFLSLKIFRDWELFRYFFESLFKVENLSGVEVLMLPLSYSLGISLGGLGLWFLFAADFPGFARATVNVFFQSFAGAVIGGLAAYGGLRLFSVFLDTQTFWGIFLQGLLAGLLGLLVNFLVLRSLGSRELREVQVALGQKFWKAKTLAADPEIV